MPFPPTSSPRCSCPSSASKSMVGLGTHVHSSDAGRALFLVARHAVEKRWLMWVFVFAVVGPYAANELGWVYGGGGAAALDRAGHSQDLERFLAQCVGRPGARFESSASGSSTGCSSPFSFTCGPQDRLGPEPAPAHKATPHGFLDSAEASPARPANRDDAHGERIENNRRDRKDSDHGVRPRGALPDLVCPARHPADRLCRPDGFDPGGWDPAPDTRDDASGGSC